MEKALLLVMVFAVVCPDNATVAPVKHTGKPLACPEEYTHHFKKYAKRFWGIGFDWEWFRAQAWAESGCQGKSVSRSGAKGVMQIVPSTFKDIEQKLPGDAVAGLPVFSDIHHPEWNIAAGVFYDRMMWNKWEAIESFLDRISFTFASYNAGTCHVGNAYALAKKGGLDEKLWASICEIAADTPICKANGKRWKHGETLNYVEKIKRLYKEKRL